MESVQKIETVSIVLENGYNAIISKAMAEHWSTKPIKNYLYNYGGKISLMQIAPMNDALKTNKQPLILNFGDFIKNAVSDFNFRYKTNIVFMANIVNALKTSYQTVKANTTTTEPNQQLNAWIAKKLNDGMTEAEIIKTLLANEYTMDILKATKLLKSTEKKDDLPPSVNLFKNVVQQKPIVVDTPLVIKQIEPTTEIDF